MAQRFLKIILPHSHHEQALDLLRDQEGLTFWPEESAEGNFVASGLMDSGFSETIMDLFEKTFSHVDGFRLIILVAVIRLF